jgi:hypothetical protein
MNRVEKQVAEEVHDLLLEARPERDDVSLARAAEITSVRDPNANDDFRANVCVAVQRLQSRRSPRCERKRSRKPPARRF